MAEVNAELLGQLLDRYGPALELFARQHCNTPADVVQEAFVQLVRQPRLPDNVAGWLYRVVRNGAITVARASARRRRHETVAAARQPDWFDERDRTYENTVELAPQAASAALQELPVDQREIVVAHLWGGLSFEQIAAVVGMSSSSAHRTYHVALIKLREILGVPVSCSHPTKTRNKTN
jgi:RNA polymerase sigma-70 factor (ECF subfamily)